MALAACTAASGLGMYEAVAAALNEAEYNPNPDAAVQAAKAMLPHRLRDDARITVERAQRVGGPIKVTVFIDWIGLFSGESKVKR